LVLGKRASFGENDRFVLNQSRWERTPMNQSTCLAVLAASAVGGVFAELASCSEEVLAEIRQLVGSFFGGRPIPGRGSGVRAADARAYT
jgi:hypothetical protein